MHPTPFIYLLEFEFSKEREFFCVVCFQLIFIYYLLCAEHALIAGEPK